MQNTPRILIGHLTSNGDILYSSAIARQIKEQDFPGCHLTWAVSNRCAKILDLNPFIDSIWEVPIENDDVTLTWRKFCQQAIEKKKAGAFDHVYLIQLIDDNLLHYNKTIRLSVLDGYPKKLTVPLEPVIKLSEKEVENTRLFASEKKIKSFKKTILFECAPLSGQSIVTPDFALQVIEIINRTSPGFCFILSSNVAVQSPAPHVVNASGLTLRENAELSKYCDLLVGCSSGITWLLTSDWAKPMPSIQLLNSNAVWFNSVVKDHEVRGKSADHVLELFRFDASSAARCILEALENNFRDARDTYHQQYDRFWCPTETSILFLQLKRFRLAAFLKFSFVTAKNNNVLFLMIVWKKVIQKAFASIGNKGK